MRAIVVVFFMLSQAGAVTTLIRREGDGENDGLVHDIHKPSPAFGQAKAKLAAQNPLFQRPMTGMGLRPMTGMAKIDVDGSVAAQNRLFQRPKDENTAMISMDSGAAKDDLQGNLTAQVGSDKPLIHILSMGRVGSCFTLGLYANCGFMTVFEPLHGLIEGSKVLSPTNANVFDCLYGCQCDGHVVNDEASKVMDKYCPNPSAQRLAIKDCRVINYKAYQTYTHPDLLKKVQTLPNLREAVGSSNIQIEIMEKWSQDVKAFARRLAAFSGEEVSETALEAAQKAQDAHGTDGAGKWKGLVPEADLNRIESHPKCSAYMDLMGYKKGSNDYSQVREPSELSSKEINLLSSSTRVDDSHELSIEELFSRLPEEVIEALMPSKMPAFPTLED